MFWALDVSCKSCYDWPLLSEPVVGDFATYKRECRQQTLFGFIDGYENLPDYRFGQHGAAME